MKRTIFFFVKVFEKKEYAKALLDGKLHINRLSYFRKIEEIGEANRSDRHEGVIGWLQPGKVIFKINDFEIPPKDMAGPISIQMNYHGNINVFCIYAAHSGKFEYLTEESLPEFRKQLEIPEDCLRMGEHAVIIRNSKEFIHRIEEAVKSKGYRGSAKLVDYYSSEEFSGHFTEQEAVFKKRIEFQHQREYRIALAGFPGDGPITLEIGDIRSFAQMCDVSDVNKGLEIKLPLSEQHT